jgi:hypothetical protein
MGFKATAAKGVTDKSGHYSHFKSNPQGGRRRVPTVPMSSGAGDIVGGPNASGNTANPVANAQRDGQPREYRLSMKRDSKRNKLESRKRNKTSE